MFPVSMSLANWLLCNGGTFSATTYPALHTLLGGTTLPNLQGVAPMGAGANGVTLGASSANGQMPAHTHTGPSHTHSFSHTHTTGARPFDSSTTGAYYYSTRQTTQGIQDPGTNGQSTATTGADGTEATGSAGSGTPNMPPYLGVAFYIKAA